MIIDGIRSGKTIQSTEGNCIFLVVKEHHLASWVNTGPTFHPIYLTILSCRQRSRVFKHFDRFNFFQRVVQRHFRWRRSSSHVSNYNLETKWSVLGILYAPGGEDWSVCVFCNINDYKRQWCSWELWMWADFCWTNWYPVSMARNKCAGVQRILFDNRIVCTMELKNERRNNWMCKPV